MPTKKRSSRKSMNRGTIGRKVKRSRSRKTAVGRRTVHRRTVARSTKRSGVHMMEHGRSASSHRGLGSRIKHLFD